MLLEVFLGISTGVANGADAAENCIVYITSVFPLIWYCLFSQRAFVRHRGSKGCKTAIK
jgi:hypothetical protein